MITRQEILQGRDISNLLTPTLESNLKTLLDAVNKLRAAYGKPMVVNSGYRPEPYNTSIGGAPNSAHITCQAIDIRDPDGAVKLFCTEDRLKSYGLWMESPAATLTWCHVQVRPAKNRIFIP